MRLPSARGSFWLALAMAGALGGCPGRALYIPEDMATDLRHDAFVADLSLFDGTPPEAIFRLVYAHSDSVLYTVDPNTLTVSEIGPFVWPQGADGMTDIAIDRNGNMIGISSSTVYTVDPGTAVCTFLSFLSSSGMIGLTYIPGSAPGDPEILIGTGDSYVYRLDPATGTQTQIGAWTQPWTASGDVVFVGGVTYATVQDDQLDDLLVSIDPATGAATEIGRTGVPSIWGLGYWKNTLYGFTAMDGIVTIDPATGLTTPIPGTNAISFAGAAVVTSAPTH